MPPLARWQQPPSARACMLPAQFLPHLIFMPAQNSLLCVSRAVHPPLATSLGCCPPAFHALRNGSAGCLTYSSTRAVRLTSTAGDREEWCGGPCVRKDGSWRAQGRRGVAAGRRAVERPPPHNKRHSVAVLEGREQEQPFHVHNRSGAVGAPTTVSIKEAAKEQGEPPPWSLDRARAALLGRRIRASRLSLQLGVWCAGPLDVCSRGAGGQRLVRRRLWDGNNKGGRPILQLLQTTRQRSVSSRSCSSVPESRRRHH